MNPLDILKAISEPVKSLFDNTAKVIDNVTTSDDERLAAKQKLVDAHAAFQVQVASLMVSEQATRADVIKTEAASGHWLASNWRPISGLSFTAIIVYNYFLAFLFGTPRVELPDNGWHLLEVCLGGYTALRSFEKAAPSIVKAIAARKK